MHDLPVIGLGFAFDHSDGHPLGESEALDMIQMFAKSHPEIPQDQVVSAWEDARNQAVTGSSKPNVPMGARPVHGSVNGWGD